MATCPHCKGPLTDSHRCPKRPLMVAAEILVCAVAGGFAGLLLVALFDPRGLVTDVDTLSVIAGALVGIGIDRAVRSHTLF